MLKKIVIKITIISCFSNFLCAMQNDDLIERNNRFNNALRGTHYDTESESLEISIRNTTFELKPYREIEKELDSFKRTELRRIAPKDLQKKLRLFSESKEFASDVLLLHGPSGSGKSSYGKLIAYINQSSYIFLKASDLGDSYKHSPQDFINTLFKSLIKKSQKITVILDEITGFTDKFEDRNSGDSGSVQHLWTTFDDCKKRSNFLIIGTLNDLKRVPGPLRNRCKEYFIGYPDYNSRVNILQNYLLSKEVSKKFLENLAKKSNNFCFRLLERIIRESQENLEIRKLDTKNSAINLSEADIQEAFDIEYKKHQGIYREQQYESWKKAFKEYAPIIIMPLFRMICDYAIQHVYHLQQISWNENCYKDNLATQERHHQDNLSQQHELAEKHHKDNLAIQERHHQANLNQQRASADKHHEENKQINERHHKDNLRLQKQHNNDSLDQQVCSGLSNILGPVTYGLVSQTGYGTVAIAAGAVVSTATTTFPKWREWVIGKAPEIDLIDQSKKLTAAHH